MKNREPACSRGGGRSETAPGLYVHVPFCATKCPYCDFYSSTDLEASGRWLAALSREMELYRGVFAPFDTIYLGGGTPSLLPIDALSRLAAALRRAFDLADGAETTIEANPDDITAEALAGWREAGFNRLSVGVQSFDDADLRVLGRRHDAARARSALELARSGGFPSVGIDLIYGVDGQSLASWLRTLEAALAFEPEHLSCYQLTIAPETSFGRLRSTGRLREPDEGAQRSFFLETSARLRSSGYMHYEVSSFARGPGLAARHNRKYWSRAPYLGLGPAAHSFRRRTRWWNLRSVTGYCEALEETRTPIAGSESLGEYELWLETLSLGFRTTDGVPLEALRRHPGWECALERIVAESLVVIDDGRAVPTVEGLCVADRLPLLFVP